MQAGNTPLHTACEAGNAKVLNVLARAAASVDTADSHGHTPLHMCVSRSGTTAGKCKCITVLARHGAELNALDGDGLAPVHYAADCGNLAAVKALVRAGCKQTIATKVRCQLCV